MQRVGVGEKKCGATGSEALRSPHTTAAAGAGADAARSPQSPRFHDDGAEASGELQDLAHRTRGKAARTPGSRRGKRAP